MKPKRVQADFVFSGGTLKRDFTLGVSSDGRVVDPTTLPAEAEFIHFKNSLIVPGLVNAHSHAFQRLLRGKTEFRTSTQDDFWSWRTLMYRAAMTLNPEQLFDAARFCFAEMAQSGITTVGEFHYLHLDQKGQAYDDPVQLEKSVISAAREVGLRICLLRAAYARAGFQAEPNPQHVRFIEPSSEVYLERLNMLQNDVRDDACVTVGMAPHSVRAVPKEWLSIFARERKQMAIHMHIAEQPLEIEVCKKEHGKTPVELLADVGLLRNMTAVHAIHLSTDDIHLLAEAESRVCACPTTERNLGDGTVPSHSFFGFDIPVCVGSDSQAAIDLLEDARSLELNLRLEKKKRNVLSRPTDSNADALGQRLLLSATHEGSKSLHLGSARLSAGENADFTVYDLNDSSLLGASENHLISCLVFGASREAVRDVYVAGKPIMTNKNVPQLEKYKEAYLKVVHALEHS